MPFYVEASRSSKSQPGSKILTLTAVAPLPLTGQCAVQDPGPRAGPPKIRSCYLT
jgi:hypothetical protein